MLVVLFMASSSAMVWATDTPAVQAKPKPAPMVTFIELGSVNCIPCKAMQPVMEAVRSKYGDQVNVVFHDVWTKVGEPYVRTFKIKVIPTQIFLDSRGGRNSIGLRGFSPPKNSTRCSKSAA
jgi:thioredoxin 1